MTPTNAWAVYLANGDIHGLFLSEAVAHNTASKIIPPMEVRPVLVVPKGDVHDVCVQLSDQNDGTLAFTYDGVPVIWKKRRERDLPATLVIHREAAEGQAASPQAGEGFLTQSNIGNDARFQRLERQVRALKNAVRYLLHWKSGDDVYQLRAEITTAFPEER